MVLMHTIDTHTTLTHTHTNPNKAVILKHTEANRRLDDCISSLTSESKAPNLSPIIWPVLGAAGKPEVPLSSMRDGRILAIFFSLGKTTLWPCLTSLAWHSAGAKQVELGWVGEGRYLVQPGSSLGSPVDEPFCFAPNTGQGKWLGHRVGTRGSLMTRDPGLMG